MRFAFTRRETLDHLRAQVAADAQLLDDAARKLVEAHERTAAAEAAVATNGRPDSGDWVSRGEVIRLAHRLEQAELERDSARQALEEAIGRRIARRS